MRSMHTYCEHSELLNNILNNDSRGIIGHGDLHEGGDGGGNVGR